LHKQKKCRARLPFNCPVNFSVRTILFLQAAWMKPRRECLAMLVHTSVYRANSQSSCDGPGILLSLYRIYALIGLIRSAPVNGVHNQSASLPMTASRYRMSARSLLQNAFQPRPSTLSTKKVLSSALMMCRIRPHTAVIRVYILRRLSRTSLFTSIFPLFPSPHARTPERVARAFHRHT